MGDRLECGSPSEQERHWLVQPPPPWCRRRRRRGACPCGPAPQRRQVRPAIAPGYPSRRYLRFASSTTP